MQTRANRILSMLLVLVMVLSMLPAAVFAAGETDALAGWNISLGDNIGVKFHLNSEDYTVTTTVNGAAVTPAISGKVVTVNVAAAQMTDTIGLTVKNGEETVHTGEYSVRQYAETILNGSYDAEVKEMVKYMLNYGAAAQTYFNYNAGNLANNGIAAENAAVPTEVPEVAVTDNLDGINLYGMSLVFRNKVAVRFYFDVTGNIANFTFSQGTPVQKDGRYYVEIDGINPQDLASDITLDVNDGALSVTYSPLTYIVRMYNGEKTSAALKSLVQAMYGYHLEAVDYQKYMDTIHPLTGLTNHPNGWSADGIYITHDAHDATYNTDWSVEYKPVSADVIKLIRDGQTYNIGQPVSGTLVVYDTTKMLFKTAAWTIQGGVLPFVDGDKIIIEGKFKHEASGDILVVEKTVICVNGSELIFNPIEAGNLDNHPNGLNSNGEGIYATMAPNAAPVDGWSVEFAPMTADAYYVIRGEEVINIGMPGRGTLVKYENTNYYLKMSSWCTDNFAYTTDDIFVIDGYWKHNASGTVMKIEKTYLYYNGSAWTFAAELPTVIDGGMMIKVDGYGWTGGTGSLIFKMDNTAPNGGYAPVEAGNVKLIRNGETYDVGYVGQNVINKSNDTWYTYEFWTIVNEKPMLANDILVIEGDFYNAAADVTMNITKTYVLLNADGSATFSAEMPNLGKYVEGGLLIGNENGWNGDGIYFSMNENEAPYNTDWSLRYKPASSEVIKLLRDGNITNIANKDAETLVKYSETNCSLATWMFGSYGLKAGDILIVEGDFLYAAENVTLNVQKSYILLNVDGSVTVSDTEPAKTTVIDAGLMVKLNGYGWNENNMYFQMAANDAPDSAGYKPLDASCIKVIRDGETVNDAMVGQDVIYKSNDSFYNVQFWTFVNTKPLKAGDIIVFEGDFYNPANDTILRITKTYALLNADGTVSFSAEMPVPTTEVDCGAMSENADGTPSEIYFTLAANSIPADEELAYPYAGTVQLVKSGNTSNVNANIYKLADDQYYLELDGAELSNGSYLIVEGAFVNGDNGYAMNIAKTYVLANGNSLVYSQTEPALDTEYALTGLTNHPNGWDNDRQGGNDGIYISHNAHGATYNTDWSVEYKPVSSDVIKLVRNGETYSVGQPVSGTLIAYGETDMFFKTEAWTIINGSSILPFVDGDKIIIEGKFKHEASGDILVVEKTVIYVDGSSLIFNPIFAGNLDNHSNGMNSNGEGIYATMAPNAAPYDEWSIEYTPVTADAYYVIRGEEVINIGMPGRGTLVKYGDTNYYLKLNSWCTNNFAYTTDDIFVIEGAWKNNSSGVVMKIEKTYLYHNGSAWVFSATEPVPGIQGGMMKAHSENKWSSTDASNPGNLWFGLDGNDAATGAYRPAAEANVKLIRNGETYVVGHTARDTINKINDTWYVLEFWTIADYKPMLAGDILIVEGDFYQASSNTTLTISKTYVLLNADGSASFSDTEPVIKPESSHGVMNVTNWQKPAYNPDGSANDGGLYFTLEENDVIFTTDWATQYKPVSADVIKVIRNGKETNVANPDAAMIIKYSETNYYLQFWPITLKPMQAGDVMIVEGKFKNASNGSVLNITKTYILFNENGTVSVYENSPMGIDAGTMGAYSVQNWFNSSYTALYFVLDSNIAPSNTDWSVRYMPKAADNVKLIRNGQTITIGNTGAETIVKVDDTLYALALDSWWWSANAPIQEGDVLVIEGEFYNASNGYTLNIDKTYITFGNLSADEVSFSAAADTEFGDVVLPSSNKSLKIGVWNGSYHIFTNERLAELKAAGITKIMGIDPQWTGVEYGGITGMLDRAAAYGIDVIVDLRSWDGETVPEYVNHPALMGFVMYDEPSTSKFDELAELKAKFDAVMPDDVLFFVNLYGSSAANSSLGIISYLQNYETHYVQKFLDTIGVKVLSWDSYPLVGEDGMRTGYFQNFEIMASKKVPMWFTMLSAGHNTTSTYYDIPTEEELRWQMAVAMTYGVQNIDHYTYTSHEDDYSCMYDLDTGAVTDLYYDIKDVNNEYLAWDNIYMAYNWVGVAKHSANSNDAMLDKLNKCINIASYGVSQVESGENLLIGVFENNGNKAYMVTNAGSTTSTTVGDGKAFTTNDTTVNLTLDAANYKCAAIIDNGEISYVAVNNNTVTLTVEAYEGVFVIPVLN